MNEERRQTYIDLTDIKLSIREIETHMKRSVPALEQAWINEKEIIKIQGFQKVIKYVGGTAVVINATIVAKFAYSLLIKHPPPPPPPIHP